MILIWVTTFFLSEVLNGDESRKAEVVKLLIRSSFLLLYFLISFYKCFLIFYKVRRSALQKMNRRKRSPKMGYSFSGLTSDGTRVEDPVSPFNKRYRRMKRSRCIEERVSCTRFFVIQGAQASNEIAITFETFSNTPDCNQRSPAKRHLTRPHLLSSRDPLFLFAFRDHRSWKTDFTKANSDPEDFPPNQKSKLLAQFTPVLYLRSVQCPSIMLARNSIIYVNW